MKAYRITVTIEAFDDEKDLLDENADSVRDWTNFATHTDREKIFEVVSEALSKLNEDPLNGSFWEG